MHLLPKIELRNYVAGFAFRQRLTIYTLKNPAAMLEIALNYQRRFDTGAV